MQNKKGHFANIMHLTRVLQVTFRSQHKREFNTTETNIKIL